MNKTIFLNELRSIFGKNVKSNINGEDCVKNARVNTNEVLEMNHVSKIILLSKKSKLRFNIKRSGTGISIKFN